MASLIGSIRNITGDPWWIVKTAFFAGLVFSLLYYDYPQGAKGLEPLYFFIAALFFGCGSIIINRNINNIMPIMPSLFNIPSFMISTVCACVSALPGILLCWFCISYIQTNFEFEPFTTGVVYLIAAAILTPFIFIPVVLYSANRNFLDIFRLNIIFGSAGNFIVSFLSYIIQYILIFATITICFYYFLLNMFGDSIGLLILKSFAITLTILSFFSFCSDLYGETIAELPQKERKKERKKDAEIRGAG